MIDWLFSDLQLVLFFAFSLGLLMFILYLLFSFQLPTCMTCGERLAYGKRFCNFQCYNTYVINDLKERRAHK